MDPGLLLTLLDGTPRDLAADHARFTGAMAPVVIPLAWATPEQRAAWTMADPDLDLALRLRFGLEAGLEEQSWALYHEVLAGKAPGPGVVATLASWAAREQDRRAWPLPQDGLVIVGARNRPRLGTGLAQALLEMQTLIDRLPGPRWVGPVVVALEAGTDRLRPALPVVHLGETDSVDAARGALGAAIADLVLASYGRAPASWPAWLRVGLRSVASERAQSAVVSPLRALRTRQAAGAQGLRDCFAASDPDPELAAAIVALLTTSRRRDHLASCLDLLRNQVDGSEAIRIAYDLDLAALLRER